MNAYVSATGRLILRSYAMPAALDLREARRWRLPNGRPVTARQIMLYSSAPPASGSLKPSASGRTYKALLIKQGATRKGSLLKKVLICLRAALGQFNQAAPASRHSVFRSFLPPMDGLTSSRSRHKVAFGFAMRATQLT